MLTQREIDVLLNMLKKVESSNIVNFPDIGGYKTIDLVSEDGKERFVIDINRKGKIKVSKCTYQNRYRKDITLLRLDIDGPPHTNPDGEVIPPNHLHIYREGFDDRWAFPLPDTFKSNNDLIKTLIDFLEYCKVIDLDKISIQGGSVQ